MRYICCIYICIHLEFERYRNRSGALRDQSTAASWSAKTQKAVIARIPVRVTDVMFALVIFLQPPQLLPTHNVYVKTTPDSRV
jgi:hypothetical protein